MYLRELKKIWYGIGGGKIDGNEESSNRTHRIGFSITKITPTLSIHIVQGLTLSLLTYFL